MDVAEAVHLAVARLRLAGTDLASIEAKRAAGGPPRGLAETISAFANGSGGLIILGLDEATGFAPVPIAARPLADALATACADDVEPPIRAQIDVVTVDGLQVVAALIPELEAGRKPCFVRSQGMQRGSYLRTHDGDRRLTSYEVHVLVTSRGQPRDDAVAVPDATLADLDPSLVATLAERLRRTRGTVFSTANDKTILNLVGALVKDERGVERPSLAGLMALGRYPQQYFPQLNTTFVAYPTADGAPLPDGTRFLDNAVIDGPVPVQVTQVLAVLQRNMSRRSLVVGLGREDRWDYPAEAIREVVVNALMHRDYHPLTHGTQVRVELFPDRLVVTSPGGLHGPVAPEELLAEPVSSSRNAVLAKLLEDVVIPGTNRTVCENRGTGLLAVSAALRAAGMQPPRLEPTIRSFRVLLSSHTMLDDEALAWLSGLAAPQLTDRQRLGLAYARRNGGITNGLYRALTGCDGAAATRDLMALGSAGLLQRESAGKSTVWRLHGSAQRVQPLPGLSGTAPTVSRRQRQVLELLSAGPRTTADLAAEMAVTPQAVLRHLKALRDAGLVVATSARVRSPRNSWQLATQLPTNATEHRRDNYLA